MIGEMLYTSATAGLFPGSRGFCTVAATAGLSKSLIAKLETLSTYPFAFAFNGPDAGKNPAAFRYARVRVGDKTHPVLSRIVPVAADYSGRSNYLAHHLILNPKKLPDAGPAWLARQPGVFQTSWNGDPRELPARQLPDGAQRPGVCHAWQSAAGDAGWGGLLARVVDQPGRQAAVVAYPSGTDVLPLFDQAIALLPAAQRWRATFDTYHQADAAGSGAVLRGVLLGTPAASGLKPGRSTVDLDQPAPPADDRFTRAARDGAFVKPEPVAVDPADVPPPIPSGAEDVAAALTAANRRRGAYDLADGIDPGFAGAGSLVLENGASRPSRRKWIVVAASVAAVLLIGSTISLLALSSGDAENGFSPVEAAGEDEADANNAAADGKADPEAAKKAQEKELAAAEAAAEAEAEAKAKAKAKAEAEAKALAEAQGQAEALADAKSETEVKSEAKNLDTPNAKAEDETKANTAAELQVVLKIRDPEIIERDSNFRKSAAARLGVETSERLLLFLKGTGETLTIKLILDKDQHYSLQKMKEGELQSGTKSVVLQKKNADPTEASGENIQPILEIFLTPSAKNATEMYAEAIPGTNLEGVVRFELIGREGESKIVYVSPTAEKNFEAQVVGVEGGVPIESELVVSDSEWIGAWIEGKNGMTELTDGVEFQPWDALPQNGVKVEMRDGVRPVISWSDEKNMQFIQRWINPSGAWEGKNFAKWYKLTDYESPKDARESIGNKSKKNEKKKKAKQRHKELAADYQKLKNSITLPFFELRKYDNTGVLLERERYTWKAPTDEWTEFE